MQPKSALTFCIVQLSVTYFQFQFLLLVCFSSMAEQEVNYFTL